MKTGRGSWEWWLWICRRQITAVLTFEDCSFYMPLNHSRGSLFLKVAVRSFRSETFFLLMEWGWFSPVNMARRIFGCRDLSWWYWRIWTRLKICHSTNDRLTISLTIKESSDFGWQKRSKEGREDMNENARCKKIKNAKINIHIERLWNMFAFRLMIRLRAIKK